MSSFSTQLLSLCTELSDRKLACASPPAAVWMTAGLAAPGGLCRWTNIYRQRHPLVSLNHRSPHFTVASLPTSQSRTTILTSDWLSTPFEFSYYIQLNLILYTKLKSGAIEAILSIHAFINAMGEKRGHNELLTTLKHITCFISLPKKDVWPCIIPKVVKYNLNTALEIRELEIFGEHSEQLQYWVTWNGKTAEFKKKNRENSGKLNLP